MHKSAFFFLLSAPLCCAVLGACAVLEGPTGAAAAATAPSSVAAGQGGDTLARIHALVGTPGCGADRECRTLALGARPCGGPEGYLAYSTAHTPAAELRALGDVYQAERRGANSRSGMMSDCRVMPDPGAVCQAGVCTPGVAAPVAR
jgi:hypothetical protein